MRWGDRKPRRPYTHPHPDPAHVMRCYRGHILGCKRKWGTARGLIHYRPIVEEYLAAKRVVIARRHAQPQPASRDDG